MSTPSPPEAEAPWTVIVDRDTVPSSSSPWPTGPTAGAASAARTFGAGDPKLQELLDNGTFSDVVVKDATGREWNLHRAILCLKSEFFKGALTTAPCQEREQARVDISSFPANGWPEVVRWMYCGQCSLTPHNAFDVLSLARALLVEGLEDICLAYIADAPDTSTCLTFLEPALAHDSSLANACVTVAARSFPAIFRSATAHLSPAAVVAILSSPYLDAECEAQVLHFALEYLRTSEHVVDDDAAAVILRQVRFPFLPAKLLQSLAATGPSYARRHAEQGMREKRTLMQCPGAVLMSTQAQWPVRLDTLGELRAHVHRGPEEVVSGPAVAQLIDQERASQVDWATDVGSEADSECSVEVATDVEVADADMRDTHPAGSAQARTGPVAIPHRPTIAGYGDPGCCPDAEVADHEGGEDVAGSVAATPPLHAFALQHIREPGGVGSGDASPSVAERPASGGRGRALPLSRQAVLRSAVGTGADPSEGTSVRVARPSYVSRLESGIPGSGVVSRLPVKFPFKWEALKRLTRVEASSCEEGRPEHVLCSQGWFSTHDARGSYVTLVFPMPVTLTRVSFSHGHHRPGYWQMAGLSLEVAEDVSVGAPFWRPIFKARSLQTHRFVRDGYGSAEEAQELDVKLPDAPPGAPSRYRAVRFVALPAAGAAPSHRVCLRNVALAGHVHLVKHLLTQQYVPIDDVAVA